MLKLGVVILLLCCAGASVAEKYREIVVVHKGALWKKKVSAGGTVASNKKLAGLPEKYKNVQRLRAVAETVFLLDIEQNAVLFNVETKAVAELGCTESPKRHGLGLVCLQGGEIVFFSPTGRRKRSLERGRIVDFDSLPDGNLLVLRDGYLLSINWKGKELKRWARVTGKRLWATPSGNRAFVRADNHTTSVKQLRTGAGDVLYAIKLDGRGAKRRLNRNANVVAVSADEEWVLLEESRKRKAACLVAVAGGQYKCWKRYTPLSLSTDGSTALLGRTHDGNNNLYLGERDGAQTRSPRRIAEKTGTAATITR